MEEGSTWVKIASMPHARAGHRMVAYENALFAVSGKDINGDPHQGTVWFDGTSWSKKAWNYGDWRIAFSCLALDSEADLFYMVGGYCPT